MAHAGLHQNANRLGSALWIALVSVASILFSLALACAMPFAAVATVAGIWMPVRRAVLLTAVAWLANQFVGYLLLAYPTTWDSFAWGAAIGVSAVLSVAAVVIARHSLRSEWAALTAGFIAAFIIYEGTLYAATAILPSGDGAFSPAVVVEIFLTNTVALVGLIVLHRAALAIGLMPDRLPRNATVGGI